MKDLAVCGYPKRFVDEFIDVVVGHIKTLPCDYYREMRLFTKNGAYLPAGEASIQALGFDFTEDFQKLLSPRTLVEKYTQWSSATLPDALNGYAAPAVIGKIEGRPVLFLCDAGLYYFERGGDAKGLLEVGLTGAFYPPAIPVKNKEI